MSIKISVESILNFMEVSGCETEYTAYYFIKGAESMDIAVSNYFDRGCPYIDEPKGYKSVFSDDISKSSSSPVKKTSSGNNLIRKVFNDTNESGIVNSQNIEQFCKALGISEDGVELYILGYVGECNLYQHFENKHIENIEKVFKSDNIKQLCNDHFNRLKGDSYYKFLKIVYRWLVIVVNEMNKGLKQGDERFKMLDVLKDIYLVVLKPNLINAVFDNLLNFITTQHKESLKKGMIQMDSFSYMVMFLETYPTMGKLVMTPDEIDELYSVPPLYSDFIEFVNKK
ncbi:Uncharacterized protein QTN25_008928 [Entamoeba marina]